MRSMSSLAKRLFFGFLMSGGIIAIFLGEGWLACHNYFVLPFQCRGIGFAVLAALFASWAAVELHRMGRRLGSKSSLAVMIFTIILILMHPFWADHYWPWYAILLAGLLLLSILLAAAIHAAKHGAEGTISALSLLSFSSIYLGVGCWFVIQIRLLNSAAGNPFGQVTTLAMFVTTVKSCDIGAYLIGRKIGRHKLIPMISPGKTWEGLAAGIVLSIIVASLFGVISGIMPLGFAALFGLMMALTGQAGDLMESMLKRDAGSKDSAKLVPEFGGVLDILDSILMAAPFAYVMFTRLGRLG